MDTERIPNESGSGSDFDNRNLVEIREGKPVTTSLKVAEVFGKQHSHVIRAIKDVLSNYPKSFNASNFGLVEYTDPKGEQRPMYLLTRDAMSVLVMGFTGAKAINWKLRFIEAFNAMEEELRNRPAVPAQQFQLPQTYLEALKDLVIMTERAESAEKQLLETKVERDIAISTKAQIGSRREAQAMAAASHATRKLNKAEEKIQQLEADNQQLEADNTKLKEERSQEDILRKDYIAAAAIPWVGDFYREKKNPRKPNYSVFGKHLTKFCEDRGVQPIPWDHPMWGHVNLYPKYLVDEFHEQCIRLKANLDRAGAFARSIGLRHALEVMPSSEVEQ